MKRFLELKLTTQLQKRQCGKKVAVPTLLEQYVYKYPRHELVALQEIIKALPLKLGAVSVK